MPVYTLHKVPMSQGHEVKTVEAEDLLAVHAWAELNIPRPRGRWIIKLDGASIPYREQRGKAFRLRGDRLCEEETNLGEINGEYFIDKAIAQQHVAALRARKAAAELIAQPKLDALEEDLNALLRSYGAGLDYWMDGDTHGIYSSGMQISVKVDGFEFFRTIGD